MAVESATDRSHQHFREHYKDKKISKWDIFYYVYGILHHPGYRTKFADNLKRELPRIPLAPDHPSPSRGGETVSDPNNPDDEEYIVRLVGQVVRVSVETVKIVEGLPEDYGAKG